MFKPTKLGYAILGLLREPMTGYAVRKVFETTPMGNYSSGPGTIYPALKRLHNAGLIEKYFDKNASKAGKSLYRLTEAGVLALQQWFRQPVTQKDMDKNLDALFLRFAFMEFFVDFETRVAFVREFKKEIEIYIHYLEDFFAEAKKSMPLHGRLAMEQGIESQYTISKWLDYALEKIIENKNQNPQKKESGSC